MAKISIDLSSGSFNKPDVIVGIDLGTTNSLVAIIDKHVQGPLALSGKDKDTIVPSLIHFGPDEVAVGKEARAFLVSNPENTVYSAKRLMGRAYKDLAGHTDYFSYKIIDDYTENLVRIQIGGRYYTPIELSSYILKELKQRAEAYLQADVKRAVITVPAYFNDAQRQATRDAGKLAGLDVLRIINEPTAASLAYGIGTDPQQEKTIAVYDLGGGTFDISILHIHKGIFEVLSTNGDTYLGGDDFDRAVVDYWIEKYQLGIQHIKSQKHLMQQMRLKAEEAKKHLTDNNSYSSTFDADGSTVSLELSVEELENCITPILSKTLACCKSAVADAGIELGEIQEVVLVGGSTRTPAVKKLVAGFFSRSSIHDKLNPDEVVALGAAVEADILAGNRKDILLLDVTPLSLGIETLGGLMDVMIPRNSKIPARVGKQYTTSVDGQVNMKITVYQGERELVKENRKLAEFDLKGIPAMPAGLPKVEVNFILNADGILNVEATELRSGVKQQITVTPQYGLTDEEVERMLKDSIENAQADVQARMLLEARNEAEQLIYTTERFIEKNGNLLNDEELQNTALYINDVGNALQANDKDKILAAIDELNEYTRPFAERLMDIAVKEALKGKKV